MQRLPIWLIGLSVLIGILAIAGCAGFSTLTGGSIPIDGDILGRVYLAQGLTPVAGASVELVNPADQVVDTQLSDATGAFAFPRQAVGQYSVRASQGANSADIVFDTTGDGTVDITMVLDTPVTIKRLDLVPAGPQLTLPRGQTLAFQVTATDANDTPVTIAPSWVVKKQIGTITAAGLFTATAEGRGKITASYGHKSAHVIMTVTP